MSGRRPRSKFLKLILKWLGISGGVGLAASTGLYLMFMGDETLRSQSSASAVSAGMIGAFGFALVLIFLLTFGFSIVVHELGHAVAARIMGWRIFQISALEHAFINSPEGWRFSNNFVNVIPASSGYCLALPEKGKVTRATNILFLASGFLANLTCTGLLWLMVSTQSGVAQALGVLTVALMGICTFIFPIQDFQRIGETLKSFNEWDRKLFMANEPIFKICSGYKLESLDAGFYDELLADPRLTYGNQKNFYIQKGWILTAQGRSREALHCWKIYRAISSDPNNHFAAESMRFMYFGLPVRPIFYAIDEKSQGREVALDLLGKGKCEEAKAYIENKLVELRTEQPDLYDLYVWEIRWCEKLLARIKQNESEISK